MPVKLSNHPTPTEVENAVKQWLNFLAHESYLSAYVFTVHDPYYHWTPYLLESVIHGYGLPYENDGSPIYKVTRWTEAKNAAGNHCYKEITFFDTPRQHFNLDFLWIGDIDYDLPLNGKWNDLTAIFKILSSENFTTLELNEIHIL